MTDVRYLLKVRPSFWGETYDADGALSDVYNGYVQEGKGLSLWRVADQTDFAIASAILVEGRDRPARGALNLMVIPEQLLSDMGLNPEHTPDHAISSHPDARRLHHDLMGLDLAACERLRDALQRRASEIRKDLRRDDLVPTLEQQLSSFQDEEVRQKIASSLAEVRHKLKAKGDSS